jgi:hypothetical protein
MKLHSFAQTILLSAFLLTTAFAQNLLLNGSFETGGLADWNPTGNVRADITVPPAGDGQYHVSFSWGDVEPNNGIISQTFSTTPGETYRLSFQYAVNGNPNVIQTLGVSVSGLGVHLLESLEKDHIQFGVFEGYERFEFPFVADSATTTLRFQDQSSVSFRIDILLDDVSVTAVPEASTYAAAITLLGLVGWQRRRKALLRNK